MSKHSRQEFESAITELHSSFNHILNITANKKPRIDSYMQDINMIEDTDSNTTYQLEPKNMDLTESQNPDIFWGEIPHQIYDFLKPQEDSEKCKLFINKPQKFGSDVTGIEKFGIRFYAPSMVERQ